MQQKLIKIWRTFRFPLLIACGSVPAPLLLTAFYDAKMLPWVWAWPLVYLVMDALGTLVRKKWRILYAVIQVGSMLVLALLMGASFQKVQICFLPISYGLLLLKGLSMAPEDRNERIQLTWYIFGIGVHLIGQFFLHINRSLGRTTLEPIAPWLMVGFLLFIAIAMLTRNQASLKDVARGKQQISRVMQRKNLLLTLGFMGIGLLISLIPAVVSGVKALLTWTLSTVLGILSKALTLLHSLKGGGGGGSGGGGSPDGPLPIAPNTSPAWLDLVVKIVTIILFVLAAALVLFFIGRKVVQVSRMLKKAMGNYLHAVSEDYVDEITDIRDEDDGTESRGKRKRKKSAGEIRKMTPEQRIRYRYQQLLYKHPEWDKGSTARENLNETAAGLYEQVRYREDPADEQTAQQFTEETKKI